MAATSTLSRSDRFHAVTASYLGWTLDAFDFFVVVFLVDILASQFGVSKAAIVATIGATLATRPVGAVVFGILADRYGRRIPLMANVIFFSTIGLLCGFSPNYTFFVVMRTLYGIGMGGEWGVGASLAMENAPPRWRGVLSGIVQSGYSMGYLIAAIAARFVLPNLGWRWMFWVGGIPALLALYIRTKVPESEAWQEHKLPTIGAILKSTMHYWKRFLFLVVLMTFMMFLSHGTQDLYPDFLKSEHHIAPRTVSNIAIFYNFGAIVGAILFGQLSEFVGRRKAMIAALALSLIVIPFWAFGWTPIILAIGAFVMQMGVQGAWGIIPAHLVEMSPDAARGLVPGFAYQLGILFASPTNTIEYALRDHLGYQWALASFEIMTIVSLAIIVWFGHEQKGKQFVTTAAR
ncbi:MAG TPA: MFS transporter [Terriglobales bacterium]|nr:MFS transporter [Terriglobales bacterium]